jgi:hypothetical protein
MKAWSNFVNTLINVGREEWAKLQKDLAINLPLVVSFGTVGAAIRRTDHDFSSDVLVICRGHLPRRLVGFGRAHTHHSGIALPGNPAHGVDARCVYRSIVSLNITYWPMTLSVQQCCGAFVPLLPLESNHLLPSRPDILFLPNRGTLVL